MQLHGVDAMEEFNGLRFDYELRLDDEVDAPETDALATIAQIERCLALESHASGGELHR
jgi:hypothetical protein